MTAKLWHIAVEGQVDEYVIKTSGDTTEKQVTLFVEEELGLKGRDVHAESVIDIDEDDFSIADWRIFEG